MSYKKGAYCDFFGAQARIYSLADQQGNVFYVGCTTMRMEIRLAQHISAAKTNAKYTNKRKSAIIRKLDYEIICTIIDMVWVTAESAYALKYKAHGLEKQWIKKYTDLGYQLCNGRLPVIKKVQSFGPEFIGKTLATSAKPNSKDNSWIKIETTNQVSEQAGTISAQRK